jgi:hypothetical protein
MPTANAIKTQISVIIWLALPVKSATAVFGKLIIAVPANAEYANPKRPATAVAATMAYFFIVEIIFLIIDFYLQSSDHLISLYKILNTLVNKACQCQNYCGS